ncbi:uncharacterized protein M421DRAFT_4956 [Didymella exigua CBS 183.55]|uniref:Uncharacterized protein n=1 Tax=Didymella exigua CBS 183.55 TaxID=1150837 RepID=A0A6A5RN86_9PLEO|nr:uncharacterized protein M421DRAFT_4956 [Didymella exigua CBS 183.55]KAF1928484.1 hypothetical protein M421DRAFT_4956 [Didymella exigua CBS 183.55]
MARHRLLLFQPQAQSSARATPTMSSASNSRTPPSHTALATATSATPAGPNVPTGASASPP